jgi:uroporphyrinogen-III decarboxylase
MTPRQRWLAAIHFQPVDRLPFWPKLDPAYHHARRDRFKDFSLLQFHEYFQTDPHVGIAAGVREERSRTAIESDGDRETRITTHRTPYGDTRLVTRFDPGSQSWHPVEFPVKNRDDILRMTEFYADATAVPNVTVLETVAEQVEELGERACTLTCIGESPLMYWVEWLAGVENAHYLMADYPEDVEALFEVMHRNLLQRTEIIARQSPADLVYLSENTSTTLISPDQYRRYCARHIPEYAEVLSAWNRPLVLHMCGHLKALLPDLARVPAAGFEAFTSPSLGNTTLLDGRTACPDKCLIGGTNAVLWTRPAEEIIAQLETDLDALPHHRGLVITSGGVMTPLCRPQTIRDVGRWLRSYPVTQ